jgi:prepilin-type N-terminal cleavage/methylation domain-containing protein
MNQTVHAHGPHHAKHKHTSAFTLIELSIVLVIISLIVGGVLVGRDLISAAAVRAQISQIEKYQTAVNTFRGKYGYVPGDIKDPDASNFGFLARGNYAGEGDGNGIIEGIWANQAGANGGAYFVFQGEQAMFWVDLSTAGLVDGRFNTATSAGLIGSTVTETTSPSISSYFPRGKIGNSYVYVWSGGLQSLAWPSSPPPSDGRNYFGVNGVTDLYSDGISEQPSLTVNQAYAMDKKSDDGLPQSGNIKAWSGKWWAGDSEAGPNFGPVVPGDGVSTSASPTTCYDNGGVAGAKEQYSMTQNGGAGVNCALSFQFQ